MKFENFHLKEQYRSNLDDLSEEELCEKSFEKYSLNEIKDIFTYYEIKISDKVLKVAKKKFVDKPNPYFAYLFAKDFLKARWHEAENIILQKPSIIYCYIKYIIKSRWIEGEKFLCKDSIYSYWYAKNILKDRFENAEPYIKKDPAAAFFYSRDILKKRWKEAEKYIEQNKKFWMLYKEEFFDK